MADASAMTGYTFGSPTTNVFVLGYLAADKAFGTYTYESTACKELEVASAKPTLSTFKNDGSTNEYSVGDYAGAYKRTSTASDSSTDCPGFDQYLTEEYRDCPWGCIFDLCGCKNVQPHCATCLPECHADSTPWQCRQKGKICQAM